MSLVANSFTDFIDKLYHAVFEKDKNDIWVSIQDEYSLFTSRYVRKYGSVITDFFNKASKEVEKFIIKEFTINGDLLL